MRFKYIIILILFGLGIQFLPAQPAMWPSAVAIRQGLNIEWFRTAAAGPDGSMIIVWSDTKYGGRDMWAQKVDANGNFLWGAQPLLIDNKFDRQEDPVIIATNDNGYVIAWIDFSTDLDGNVYAQKVSNTGQILWQQGGVPLCVTAGNQISINGCADNTGGAYLNWVDSRNPSKDIYGAHVLSDGTMPWVLNGIPFANSTGDEASNTMWEDGTGGFIIAYSNKVEQQSDIYINRFLPSGSSAWGGTQVLSNGPNDQDMVKMAPDGTGSFILTWKDMRATDPQIYAQRVNLDGQFLWANPVNVYPEPDTILSNQTNPRIVQSSDSGAIIVWEDNRNDDVYTDLYAQKLSISGSLLWPVSGIAVSIAPFHQKDPRLIDDSNGGCFVVWDDTRDGNYPNVDIYSQHILTDGTMVWETNGRPVCNAPGEQSGSLIKRSGNDLFVCWADSRNGSIGLYYQVVTTAGTNLLEANGKRVIWGLSGDAVKDQSVMLKRSNDVVVIWQDTRFANFGYQIFFQIIRPDSTVLMPVNGKPITAFSNGNQESPSAVVTPDGQIAITWKEQRGEYPKVYAQLLDINGNYLWGDMGMEVTLSTPIEQRYPKISYEDGAFYIGWSNSDSLNADSRLFRIWGQKIVNGERMWGANGKLISETPVGANPTECLMQRIVGRYFVWLTQDVLYAKLVDATTGNSAPGWNVNGNRSSRYVGDGLLQLSPIAAAAGDGLVVVWEDLRNQFIKNLYAQKYNVDGLLAWDSLGVHLGGFGHEQDQSALYIADGVYIPWRENVDGATQDILMQKLSMSGEPMWDEDGIYVIQRPSTQSAPSIAPIDNDINLLVPWEDTFDLETDILMRRIGSNGVGYDNALGYVVSDAPKSQFNPSVVSMGNYQDFIVWEDARSSGKTEIDGLYIQFVDYLHVVPNSDLVTPAPVAVLYNNYPNPFNPETTISFSLHKQGKAKLEIFNIKGQKVRTLLDDTVTSGLHNIVWNGNNDDHKSVGSGVYFYRLTAGHLIGTKKMILIK